MATIPDIIIRQAACWLQITDGTQSTMESVFDLAKHFRDWLYRETGRLDQTV